MGKFVDIAVSDAYRLWAATYDREPNPLLSLEARTAEPLLGSLAGARVIDLCTGTGRWMTIAARLRANVAGIDLSPEMLGNGALSRTLAGRLVIGNVLRLPFADKSADLAICSFAISYIPSIDQAFREMARVARRVMVSDMHPDCAAFGWTRSFKAGSYTYRIRHHWRPLVEIEAAARAAGLRPEYDVAARLGEPERALFASSGRLDRFEAARQVTAIFVKTWS